ncbi:ferredoxin-thioredoxin reductase catalytic domain-containing protein [Nanoarchaeota archaeon]
MTGKKFWRCNVCNDIHHGNAGPETCPTCGMKNAYCEISENEARNLISAEGGTNLEPEQTRTAWENFTQKNDFILNPDKEHVDTVLEGVYKNEDKFGLKLCPCRLRDGSRPRDLELICPCNFKTHETWKEKGECWCGLFVKG